VPEVTATSTTFDPHALLTVPMSTPWSSDQALGGSTRLSGRSGNTQPLAVVAPPLDLSTPPPRAARLTAVCSATAVLRPTLPVIGRRPLVVWKRLTAPWVIVPK
jgi:hypothetical protein